jgi:uncharacterized membrane protein
MEVRRMKTSMIIGIVLIVLGVVALAYEGITYTTREKVVDIGPLKASVERKKTIPLSPVLGGAALVGGIVLVLAGSRRG